MKEWLPVVKQVVSALPWRLFVAMLAVSLLTIGTVPHVEWWKILLRLVGGFAIGMLAVWPEVRIRTPRSNPHDAAVQLSIELSNYDGSQLLAFFQMHPAKGVTLHFHPALIGRELAVGAVIISWFERHRDDFPPFPETAVTDAKPS